jgi:D-aspartate ligase
MSRKNNNYAVVLGLGVNGLAHVRALGKNGIKVFGVFTAKDGENLGRLSRFCTPLLCKLSETYTSDLLQLLLATSQKLPVKPVLFATSDFFVDFMSANQDALRTSYLFNVLHPALLQTITNKRTIGEAALKHGIHYPQTCVFSSRAMLEKEIDSLKFPCIVKPNDSFTVIFPGKNFIAKDKSSLLSFFDKHPELIDKTLTQQIIPGKETGIFQCTGYFNTRGDAVQFCTIQKIHQFPPNFGITMYGKTVNRPDLSRKAIDFLKSMSYTGFASVEFKQNEQDNEYYLIEVNPRLPWYCGLFDSAGVNLPLIYFFDQKRPEEVARRLCRQQDNVYWMYFRNELAGLIERKAAGEKASLMGLAPSLLKTRSFAYWRVNDPVPFIGAIISFLSWMLGKLVK